MQLPTSPASKTHPLAREISFSLPKTLLEGRRGGGGGCCAAGDSTAGAAGPRWQHRSAAKREEDAAIPGRQESSESSAGTLDISLPGWAGPPLQKSAVYTYKQAVYAAQEDFGDNTERSLPRGTNSPLQHKAGAGEAAP